MKHGIGEPNKKISEKENMLTEGPCLAHYEKDKDNRVTSDSSTTGLRTTLWQKKTEIQNR